MLYIGAKPTSDWTPARNEKLIRKIDVNGDGNIDQKEEKKSSRLKLIL